MGRIAVVGGSNVDIQGFPINHLTLGDSNPGRIVITPGGVGRNVAENAARMGSEVRLISAFGDDEGAALLVKSLSDAGVDISASCVLDDHRSSSYLCILDESGRLHVAVSDMELAAEITPELVERGREAIEWSSVCVIDANLPSATIDHICRSFPARRVLLDSVSEAKAPRAAGSLGRLYAIKPNRREAEVLTGVSIRSDDDLPRAAERLHGQGITAVFISLGARGLRRRRSQRERGRRRDDGGHRDGHCGGSESRGHCKKRGCGRRDRHGIGAAGQSGNRWSRRFPARRPPFRSGMVRSAPSCAAACPGCASRSPYAKLSSDIKKS